jgi:hypothetical protein
MGAPLTEAPLPPLNAVASPLKLVDNHISFSEIVLSSNPTEQEKKAAESFAASVKKSTGAEIPILLEATAKSDVKEGVVQIFIGDTSAARAEGLKASALPEETYRLIAKPGKVILVGRDRNRETLHSVDSKPTTWALNQILDQYLGVRWLWPGKLGTYIPKSSSLFVPQLDVTYQPDLMLRRLRLIWSWMSGDVIKKSTLPQLLSQEERDTLIAESVEWLENHQNGQRGNIKYGHAFADWWDKYSKDHPDYFAVPPPGYQQPLPNEKSVKLRLSNPAVIEQIAKEYEEKGAPTIYNVCPNDGYGFDTSEETRKWDWPPNQNIDDIWIGKGNLTARYIHFWNLLYKRLKQINPDVVLISYAYASYRIPPPTPAVEASLILGIVDSYSAYDTWNEWKSRNVRMILRPNWWVVGADAPHIPLQKTADFLKFTRANNLIGIDKDSIGGYWATQGVNYYLMARLIERPNLAKDQIVDEYASAFGPAREKIKQYIAYWEGITEQAGYTNHAGSIVSENPNGIYERLVKEKNISFNPRLGSYWIMPYLYTDEVTGKGEAFLNEAKALLNGDGNAEARERVDFLTQGLVELKTIRDLVAAAAKIKEGDKSALSKAEYKRQVKKLRTLRQQLSRNHVVWGELLYIIEDKLKIPTSEENLTEAAPDLRGR